MGFASGAIAFRRFAVIGQQPTSPGQDLLDKLHEYRLQLGEYSVPDEIEYGWCGGRHIFDEGFTFEHNVYSDCINFAMRIDTNKVPSEIRRAYQVMEEDAAAASNPSGHIAKRQKKDSKDI